MTDGLSAMKVANKPNIKADVYRNLNRDCLSIRSRERHNYGRVVAYADVVRMDDVSFVVRPAGREIAVETGRKNPHAFVRGVTMAYGMEIPGRWVHVDYDPFARGEFYRSATDEAISSAGRAIVTTGGVYVPP